MLSTRLQTDKKWIDGKTDRQMNRQTDLLLGGLGRACPLRERTLTQISLVPSAEEDQLAVYWAGLGSVGYRMTYLQNIQVMINKMNIDS